MGIEVQAVQDCLLFITTALLKTTDKLLKKPGAESSTETTLNRLTLLTSYCLLLYSPAAMLEG